RPVEDRQRRRIVLLEELPRLLAAGGRHDLVAPAGQRGLVQATDDRLVIDDQHSHVVASRSSRSAQAGSAKNAMTLSSSPAIFATSAGELEDRKSTRLNSSHGSISYAGFCLKIKTKNNIDAD